MALAGVILAGCASKELASNDDGGVFVEVEQPAPGEIGSSETIFGGTDRTRRVRLSDERVAELDAAASAPQQATARPAGAKYCPPLEVLNGTGVLTAYATGGNDTPQDIAHQATITRSGRECSRNDGNLTLRIGAAGRVVNGPKGATPNVNLPIRVAVVKDDKEVLFSQLFAHPVTFAGASAQGFSFVRDDISIPAPEFQNVKVLVGFDTKDGPLAAATSSDPDRT
ncbi:MAG: hypothetical protein AAFW47_02585 [Pseudomonadota bacterium]